jgi:hypothetical protein
VQASKRTEEHLVAREQVMRLREQVLPCRSVSVTRIAFQACSFNYSDTVPSIPLNRSALAGTRCGPTQERHLARPQPFRTPEHFSKATRHVHSGSIDGVGWRFQSFRINDLELVDQIFPRWNPLTSWIRQIDAVMRAA